MNLIDVKELHELLYSFMGLFHEKFLIRFRQHDPKVPGLKKNHLKIMGLLFQNEFLMSSEIGRRLDIEKGSITTLIDQLVEMGLAVRRSDPGDRRKSQISLSETGREEMRQIMEQHIREILDYLQGIPDREIEQFIECMRYAVDFINKI